MNLQLKPEHYEKIKTLLESDDKENNAIGYEIVENSIDINNLGIILILMHEVKAPSSYWKDKAPKVSKWILETVGYSIDIPLSWKYILDSMVKHNVSKDSYEFYMERFSKYILDYYPETIIKDIKIQITFKDES